MLMMAPYTLQLLTGLAGRAGLAFNVTISNVPGPKHDFLLLWLQTGSYLPLINDCKWWSAQYYLFKL
ncbi:MAG: hypothetical protein ACJAS1_005395 [Oleiphilaceae bacterium]|jgi:hypothetical protein